MSRRCRVSSIEPHLILAMIVSTRSLAPPSQSSQHKLNTAVSLPMQFGDGSPCLTCPPFANLPAGNTLSHLKIPSFLKPILSAALILAAFNALAFQATLRSPRPPCVGRSSAQCKRIPTALDATCVRWNGGKTITNPISVLRLVGELSKYPINPAKSPSRVWVLSKMTNKAIPRFGRTLASNKF